MSAPTRLAPARAAAQAARRPWHRQALRWSRARLRRMGWIGLWRRWSLWLLLWVLVAAMLVTLVWLAGRHEAEQVQNQLERDAAGAVVALRAALHGDLGDLQALRPDAPAEAPWQARAEELLRTHRALLRVEWRDRAMAMGGEANTPYAPLPWDRAAREAPHSEVVLACANAQRIRGASYADSYFHAVPDGTGAEVLEACVPLQHGGFVVATYGLHRLLTEVVAPRLQPAQEVSFTEPDGTRLALARATRRGSRMFTARQLLNLPGTTLVLRLDGWHQPPSVFPNVLTALVTVISIALVSVLAVLVRDNRRRLSAEHELGETLAFRKAMENSLLTGLRARDMAGRITYVNPAFCRMVGYEASELLGQRAPPPYWPPEFAQAYAERQRTRMTTGAPALPQGYEVTYARKDGTRFPVAVYEAPLVNAHGVQTGWMGSFLDVSEQRRAEEVSRASQERLQASARLATVGEMASLLSHELNQPLAAIASYTTGSLNLLTDSPDAHEPPEATLAELRGALERIATQAERAGRVIKSVHDFLRRREHVRERVAAADLLDAVLPLVRLQARKLGVEVRVELAEPGACALCDRTMVEQVLLNLARNAMQAMEAVPPAERVLRLGARRVLRPDGPAWLEFSVADRGVGIDAALARRLFTPFFTTRAEGMGLGLSLCRTVVEQHGGALDFAPCPPRGTVFTFTLPMSD